MQRDDKLRWLLSGVHPILKLMRTLGDIQGFRSWLMEQHNQQYNDEVLHGHKFFLECGFSCILSSLQTDTALGFKSDFLLDSAGKDHIYLLKLPNSCEKTIFLKNIHYHFKPVLKAKTVEELDSALRAFFISVAAPFEHFFSEHIRTKKSKRLSSEQIERLLLVEKLYIFFNQINNNGPYAHMSQLMQTRWIPKEKMSVSFFGYKLAVQFAWRKVIGETMFNQTCLRELHNTISWRGFIYNEPEDQEESDDSWMFNQTFDINKQTSYHAFFYKIQHEVIRPLESRFNMGITQVDKMFIQTAKKINPSPLRKLCNEKYAIEEKRTLDEQITMLLYWFPVEISESTFPSSVSTFVTLLYGAVGLLSVKEKELRKVYVRRFVHPHDSIENAHDYSYAILIDSKASAGHYSSAWLLFYDCCCDYTGGSGGEHKKLEEALVKITFQKKVELIEFEIGHNEFRKYIADYVHEKEHQGIKQSVDAIESELAQQNEANSLNKLIEDSQGLLLELVSCYLTDKQTKYSRYTHKAWSTNTSGGEVDVILTNKTEVHIIECKLNPQSYDLNEQTKKLERKINHYSEMTNRTYEFWFWFEPSEPNRKFLLERKINYVSLINYKKPLPKRLKAILNYRVNGSVVPRKTAPKKVQ